MKKFKHILSLVLAVLLLLAACSTVPADPTSQTSAVQTKPTEEEKIPSIVTGPVPTYPDPAIVDITCQYLPKTVENPDNLPVLKWVCLPDRNYGGKYDRVWNEAAAIELNQMLADRNMPFRVQFAIYTPDYDTPNMDWFARKEVQEALENADLINGTIAAERVKDYFMPLTEYAKGDATPTLKNAVPHEINWLQSSVNGEVYGISQVLRYPKSGGWVVDVDVLQEYGLTEQDFQKDFWEIDKLLEIISEKSGKKQVMFFSPNYKSVRFPSITHIGFSYPGIAADMLDAYFGGIGSVFAVVNDQDVPTVVNMLDTETANTIREAIVRYKTKYAVADSRISKVYFGSSMIGHRSYTVINNTYGTNKRYIPIGDSTYYTGESLTLTRCSGVAVGTNYKNEALSLLNLIAEDEEFRMQLMFGKEGRDYTVDAEGNYSMIEQEDGTNYSLSFLSPWSNFSGMVSKDTRSPGTEGNIPQYDGMTVLESYLDMWENVGEPYYTVSFDYTDLEDELEAVRVVCDQYFRRFASLTDEEYAEMIEKINEAGGTKIMAELQKQLDEWVKANPDKVAANRS